ncbi:MAG: hypothetical protein JST00_22210 [Deltaproteobacteria bacterium]|nr:hypothetical protein [Deltaproteobacteria bacterium]
MSDPAASELGANVAPAPHVMLPPAARARRIALVLSAIAVGFSLVFGYFLRKTIHAYDPQNYDAYAMSLLFALVFLLGALLFRIFAAVCELLWLERTWSNLPEELRTVGPVEKVSSPMVIGFSVVPGLSYVWKLGLVLGIVDGFESLRPKLPFTAKVPRRLGMAAVIVGWVPGLNVYLAPFLWEMFATRMDVVIGQLLEARKNAG